MASFIIGATIIGALLIKRTDMNNQLSSTVATSTRIPFPVYDTMADHALDPSFRNQFDNFSTTTGYGHRAMEWMGLQPHTSCPTTQVYATDGLSV